MTTTVQQVLIACACGTLPLADAHQPDPGTGWTVAAVHVALNPSCKPTMTWIDVPASLALPRPPRTAETCAYPNDRDGEHDHADCEDGLFTLLNERTAS